MITLANYKDHDEIIEVWEQSVRATHHFLNEQDFEDIKSLIPSILELVKVYTDRAEDGSLKGFAGVRGHKMEMLFVHPKYFGQKSGTRLTNFCIYSLQVNEVDVNEQNKSAIHFYKRMGYRVVGRNVLESLGKPFQVLRLKHGAGNSPEGNPLLLHHSSVI